MSAHAIAETLHQLHDELAPACVDAASPRHLQPRARWMRQGNSSTATRAASAGVGGAPNMGSDPHGRRHATGAWLQMRGEGGVHARGRKLVVQLVQSFRDGMAPTLSRRSMPVEVGKAAGLPLPPVMIYGDDVTHVVTEEGIAYLYLARDAARTPCCVAAVAGVTPLGMESSIEKSTQLRKAGIVALPEDLGVRRVDARRSLLAAHNYARDRRMVGWPVRTARALQELVMNDMLALATPGIGAAPRLPAETLANLPCRPYAKKRC